MYPAKILLSRNKIKLNKNKAMCWACNVTSHTSHMSSDGTTIYRIAMIDSQYDYRKEKFTVCRYYYCFVVRNL